LPPPNERQCRELARLRDDSGAIDSARVAAWGRAVARAGDAPVTARLVRQAVEDDRGPRPRSGAFDYPAKFRRMLCDLERRVLTRWPSEHHAALPDLLERIAHELRQGSTFKAALSHALAGRQGGQ
jgi:hypothetical protein